MPVIVRNYTDDEANYRGGLNIQREDILPKGESLQDEIRSHGSIREEVRKNTLDEVGEAAGGEC